MKETQKEVWLQLVFAPIDTTLKKKLYGPINILDFH